MREVVSTLFKRSTLALMSSVLAMSSLLPLATAQIANAASNGPLTVDSVCIEGKVVHNFTFHEETQNWLSGDVFYKALAYGKTAKHSLPTGDVDVWSVNTGLANAPSVNVKADVVGFASKSNFPFITGKSYSYSVATDPTSCAQLNGENFNTVSDPYKGISVGFNTKDFGTVSAVSVTIERADGSTVTKNANSGVLDLISNVSTATQLTAPFVIQEGTFTEADDTTYWAPAPATWTAATAPVKATVNVTDQYGTKSVEILNLSQGSPSWPTYKSLLPVAPTAPPTNPVLSGEVIYSSIPSMLPSNSTSLGYAATSTNAFGDKITFGGTGRELKEVAVNLSSWACESGTWNNECETTPGATFEQPVTLNIYDAEGNVIASRTQTFEIPYRPTADPTCGSATQWRDTNGNCFNGINHVVVFDATGITVPNTVIYSVAFNTQSHGSNPTGTDGPFNSLNVALSTTTSVGTNVNPDEAYWDTTYPGYTAGLKADNGWSESGNPAVVFTAKIVTPSTDDDSTDGGDSSNGSKGSSDGTTNNGFGDVALNDTSANDNSNADSSDIKGASTENDQKVLGDETSNTDTKKSDAAGMAWYWWVLIVAAILALLWAILAAIRRRRADA